MQPASTEAEFKSISKAENAPFIRSLDDWKEAVDAAKNQGQWRFIGSPDDVLSKCSDEALQEWEDNVQYRNGGLAHGRYALLQRDIGDKGLIQFFGLHGLQEELASDYMNRECKSHGTCSLSPSDICTSNC